MIATPNPTILELSPALAAQGLTVCRWRDDAAFQRMAVVLNASRNADSLEEARNGDDLSSAPPLSLADKSTCNL